MPTINRETIIGWNYTAVTNETGAFIPCDIPKYANTIEKLMKQIDNEVAFQTMREYRFKYIRYWFIQVNDEWKRLSQKSNSPMTLLFINKHEVEVTLE